MGGKYWWSLAVTRKVVPSSFLSLHLSIPKETASWDIGAWKVAWAARLR